MPSHASGETYRYDVHNKFSWFQFRIDLMAITRYGRTKTLIWFLAGSPDSIAVAAETKMAACSAVGVHRHGEDRVKELAPRKKYLL